MIIVHIHTAAFPYESASNSDYLFISLLFFASFTEFFFPVVLDFLIDSFHSCSPLSMKS